MPLFGKPDIEKMEAKGDMSKLVKSLRYTDKKNIDATLTTRRRALVAIARLLIGQDSINDLNVAALLHEGGAKGRASKAIPASLRHEAIQALQQTLLDPELARNSVGNRIRADVAGLLGAVRDKESIDALVACMNMKIPAHNIWGTAAIANAASSLGSIGDTRATPALIAAIREWRDNVGVVSSCVLSLGRLGDLQALETLISLLTYTKTTVVGDVGPSVRARSAQALAKLADPRAIQPIINALSDEGDTQAHDEMIFALGRLAKGTPRDTMALVLDALKKKVKANKNCEPAAIPVMRQLEEQLARE